MHVPSWTESFDDLMSAGMLCNPCIAVWNMEPKARVPPNADVCWMNPLDSFRFSYFSY